MDTYRRLEDIPTLATSALTIGSFDGLHRGHLAVIEQLISRAHELSVPAAVLTFDPHPKHVLQPESSTKFEILATLAKKLSLLEAAGVDLVAVVTFDEPFSRLSPQEFLEQVVMKYFSPARIVVGYDHHFGHERKGNTAYIREQATVQHYDVDVVDQVDNLGEPISSSRIRQLLREGLCEEAEVLLGWPYELAGEVAKGDGRGRMLDFPTANLRLDEPRQLIPKWGVYVISSDMNGQTVYGMCNVGVRPTFNGETVTVEAHFIDPPLEDLYARQLAFRFLHRLRDEQKFSGPDELRAQLERDKTAAQSWVAQLQLGDRNYAPAQ